MATPFPPATAAIRPSCPPYNLQKGRYTSTMQIGPWEIKATKKPILNGKEIDAAEKSLNLPLPEMTFGNNSLVLSYDPSFGSSSASTKTGASPDQELEQTEGSRAVQIGFYALEALRGVAVGEGWEERVGGGVKVSMAEQWGKNRSTPSALLSDTPLPTQPVKPHDWTYSTCYAGSVAGPSTFRPSTTHEIPMKLLARQDPVLDHILYYDDVGLYEDELHDNGDCIFNVRIRVMPHSFFILSRLFLRVDNVLFRTHDVRIYHAFGSGEVIREVLGMEASYNDIKARLEKPSDLSPLTDPNWVYAMMSSMQTPDGAPRPKMQSRDSSGGVSGGGDRPWPGLGKRVEVLELPGAMDGATSGLGKMSIAS